MSPNSVDIIIGIPSLNECKTISAVTSAADQGVTSYFPHYTSLIVNADNGSTDGTSEAFLGTPTKAQKYYLNTGHTPCGKGVNILELLKLSIECNAKAVCLLDADVTSVESDWVHTLLQPAIVNQNPTLVTPLYTRNRYEGNTTNHIVYPLLYAVFGVDVRQPIAGEFALNRTLIKEVLTWPLAESTLHYGIDVFLTANSAANGYPIFQTCLTRKLHNPGFPKILHMSQQVLDTLLRIILSHNLYKVGDPDHIQKSLGNSCSVDEEFHFPEMKLVLAFADRVATYITNNKEDIKHIFPSLSREWISTWGGLSNADVPLINGLLPVVDTKLWVNLLSDGLMNIKPETFYFIRDSLVSFYLCRVFTYWNEISCLASTDIDQLLRNQSEALRQRITEIGHPITTKRWCDIPSELKPGVWAERKQ